MSREQIFSFKPYISNVDGIGEENCGTTLVKYSPTGGIEDNPMMNAVYHCISFIKEYADKSQEELRLEDYKAGRYNRLALGNFLYKFNRGLIYEDPWECPNSNFKPPVEKTGAALACKVLSKRLNTKSFVSEKRRPKSNFESPVEKTEAALAYEVLSKRFKMKLFVPKKRHGVGEQDSGTTLVKYNPRVFLDIVEKAGNRTKVTVINICITAMKEYENKSLEELRLEDYRAGRNLLTKYIQDFHYRPKVFVFGFNNNYAFSYRKKGVISEQSKGTALVKYSPTLDKDFIHPLNSQINVKINCITTMKEYKDKSLEELRLEDYEAGRVHGGSEECSQPHTPVISTDSDEERETPEDKPLETDDRQERREIIEESQDSLKFHKVHGTSIRISKDGTTADNKIKAYKNCVAFSSRPIRVGEMVCLRLVENMTDSEGLAGIIFGFTTKDPSTLLFVPKHAITWKDAWIIISDTDLCINNNILHYHVDSNGEMRFGVNGQVEEHTVPGIDISRPLWAVLEMSERCKTVQFVGPETLKIFVRATDEPRSLLEDGAIRPAQVVDGPRRSNQTQLEDGAGRPEQVLDGPRRSNQTELEDGARRPAQVLDGPRRSNQTQLEDGARRPAQVVDGPRRSNQTQLEDGARRPEQVLDGPRRSNQTQLEDGARRPAQVVDGPRRSNQSQLEDGARRPAQVVDGPRRSNQTQLEDDPLLDQLSSLSVVERSPVPRHKNPAPLKFHTTKGKNIRFTGSGVAARNDGEYCQGYVFTERPMRPGSTITAQVLRTNNSYKNSLTIGLTSCDPAILKPDELPDDSKFLEDRPEYWIVYPNAADRFDIGDELNVTFTTEGVLEVRKNCSSVVVVLHVDNTVGLWAFFDVCGATIEVRLFVSELVRSPGQVVNGARRPDQVVNGVRRPDQIVNGARRPDQVVNGARRPDQVVNGARRPDQVVNQARRPDQVVNGARRPDQVANGPRRRDQVVNGAGPSKQVITRATRPEELDKAKQKPPTNISMKVDMPSTSKNNEEPIKVECTICFDNKVNCVIYKCGHMCMCYDCAIQMWKSDGRAFGKCPICRSKIVDVIKTYL